MTAKITLLLVTLQFTFSFIYEQFGGLMVYVGERHVIMYANELLSSGGESTSLLELSTFPYFIPVILYGHSVLTKKEYLRSLVILGLCLIFNWFVVFLVSLDASIVYSVIQGDLLLFGMMLNSMAILLTFLIHFRNKEWTNRVMNFDSL